jgi:flagellar export protein FliJ
MPFRFRFERVLEHREAVERQALLEKARVEGRRDQELRGLGLLLHDAERLRDQWNGLMGKATPSGEINWLWRRSMVVRGDCERQRAVVAEWEARLKDAEGKWLDARKATKSLRLLKEREFHRFVQRIHKAELAQLDEASRRPFLEGVAAEAMKSGV